MARSRGLGDVYKRQEYKQACQILEGDGYTVKFFYEERQFVAMYTTVEW
jgi:hypothetical protein